MIWSINFPIFEVWDLILARSPSKVSRILWIINKIPETKIEIESSKLKKYQFKLYGADKNFDRKQSLNNNVEIYDKIPHRLVPKIISRLDVLLMPFEKKISINAKNIRIIAITNCR